MSAPGASAAVVIELLTFRRARRLLAAGHPWKISKCPFLVFFFFCHLTVNQAELMEAKLLNQLNELISESFVLPSVHSEFGFFAFLIQIVP